MYSTGSVMVQISHGVDLGFLKHVIVYWGVSMHTEVHRAPVITPLLLPVDFQDLF